LRLEAQNRSRSGMKDVDLAFWGHIVSPRARTSHSQPQFPCQLSERVTLESKEVPVNSGVLGVGGLGGFLPGTGTSTVVEDTSQVPHNPHHCPL
jgi:hypothetical protein